jgi:hypothetical protein
LQHYRKSSPNVRRSGIVSLTSVSPSASADRETKRGREQERKGKRNHRVEGLTTRWVEVKEMSRLTSTWRITTSGWWCSNPVILLFLSKSNIFSPYYEPSHIESMKMLCPFHMALTQFRSSGFFPVSFSSPWSSSDRKMLNDMIRRDDSKTAFLSVLLSGRLAGRTLASFKTPWHFDWRNVMSNVILNMITYAFGSQFDSRAEKLFG